MNFRYSTSVLIAAVFLLSTQSEAGLFGRSKAASDAGPSLFDRVKAKFSRNPDPAVALYKQDPVAGKKYYAEARKALDDIDAAHKSGGFSRETRKATKDYRNQLKSDVASHIMNGAL